MGNSIIALATPPLNGALAILRLSGDDVFAITDQLFSKPVSSIKEKTILYGKLSDQGSPIDYVILLVYPGPNTMTGEDVVEICCHGSMLIVEQIVQAYLSRGVSYATRGEFSARAFYNGKMDLIEAESINDLINATTVEAKNLALLSLSGQTSKLVAPLKEKIADLLALLEVNIDYPEYEDIETIHNQEIERRCHEIRTMLASLIAQGDEGKIIRNGVKVALVGAPNVGKSSLLNALLEQEKAIVSDIPGTTRDIVEGELNVHGVAIHLLDTAGIRESEDGLESLGMERSKKSIEEADLVLLVLDAEKGIDEEAKEILRQAKDKKVIIVYNKADLLSEKEEGVLYVSALTNDVSPLKEAIYESLHLSDSSFATPSFSNARELAILRCIDEELTAAEKDASNGISPDLLAASLHRAYNLARSLLGEDPTQDLTDEIFSRFCVGK